MNKNDNDVVIVGSTSKDYGGTLTEHNEDKPLMMLFKRLIGNDNKQNTVLTNAQIIDILQKEFNMDILYIHELEIDIYLNILKKFLKDWPQWDEFDTSINTLKNQKDHDSIKTMLETNYESLKAYLMKTLKSVEPLLKKTIEEVKQATIKEDNTSEDDVVMQLQCTRQQLNQLFFRRPHPSFNNTIFNVESSPAKIRLEKFSLESLLNWPNVRICMNLTGQLLFRRDMVVTFKHVLVNKKLNYAKKPPEVLKTNLQMRGSKLTTVELEDFFAYIDEISAVQYQTHETQELVQAVCRLIKSDFENGPKTLYWPTLYRRFLSKSPYVRYLYSEVNTNAAFHITNYDLQLEETAIPQIQCEFLSFSKKAPMKSSDISTNGSFLIINCQFCAVTFNTTNLFQKLKQHFEDVHYGEADWKCTRCDCVFTMEQLTMMKWEHMCEPSTNDTTSYTAKLVF